MTDKQLGTEDWTTVEAGRRLGNEFITEAWWVKRELQNGHDELNTSSIEDELCIEGAL